MVGQTTTIHLNTANVVNVDAVRLFARYKANILRQRPEVLRYAI